MERRKNNQKDIITGNQRSTSNDLVEFTFLSQKNSLRFSSYFMTPSPCAIASYSGMERGRGHKSTLIKL
jgi:hypothetical protein